MIQTFFSRRLPAGGESARQLRAALQPVLARLGVAREIADGFLLALSEVAVNVVRHASPPAETIGVTLLRDGDCWVLDLDDDGEPFEAFDRTIAEADLDDLEAEDGRGLAIIVGMFPDHAYVPGTGGARNRLRLRAPAGEEESARAHVLLVDDDPSFLRLLAIYLGEPYRVTCCDSVAEAMAALEANDIDLIISDIDMPGKSGLALREALSENPGTDTLPFIFLTGQDDAQTRQQVSGLSIDDYLVKPVRRDQLQELVARRLRRTRQVRQRLGQRLDRDITNLLQPSLPAMLGPFATAVRWRSASSGGGDLLLVRPVDDGHLLMLADLMGHGEQAKFFAHAYAGYLYGLIRASGGVGPAALLATLSDLLAEDPVLSRTLATVLALHLGDDGSVTVASAGHPAPLRVGADGIEVLEVGGMLPGLLPGTVYEELRLAPGGRRLALFTDGLFEQGSSVREREATERAVREALAASAGLPLAEAGDMVIGALDARCDGAPDDDVTLVLLEAPV